MVYKLNEMSGRLPWCIIELVKKCVYKLYTGVYRYYLNCDVIKALYKFCNTTRAYISRRRYETPINFDIFNDLINVLFPR